MQITKKMSDVANIITAVAAQHAMDENDVETLLGTFLNTLLELAAMVRQIQDPPCPLPPLIIFNLDDQNVWTNAEIRESFRYTSYIYLFWMDNM